MSLTLALKNQLHKTPQIGMKSLLGRLGIRQKIGCGYAFVVGIAILGAVAGRGSESYQKQQVREKLAIDRDKAEILTNLKGQSYVRVLVPDPAGSLAVQRVDDRRTQYLA